MKTYPLSMSRNYVASWGLGQAIRELIQNALDSDSPFSYEFDKGPDGKVAISIQSAGVTLSPSTLLLGVTSKADDDGAIGSFGEGFKIALLVLVRDGYGVRIHNGPVMWWPEFEHSDLFGGETLVVHERPICDSVNSDLKFEVYGLSDEDASVIRESCLLMQDPPPDGVFATVEEGEILLHKPGMLYVGNLFVCQTGMRFGYNVKPQYLSLDRDRQTVSNYCLQTTVLSMWNETEDYDTIADMIDREVPDVGAARFGGLSEGVKKACFELFRKRHPNALVAQTQEQLDKLLQDPSRSAVRVNYGMYEAISAYGPYRASYVAKQPPTPTERLEDFFQMHGDEFIPETHDAFQALIEEAKNWIIK